MPTIEINVDPYAPEESDAHPTDYLVRAGEAFLALYGYDYHILVAASDPVTRQLQVNIPANAPGGTRAVVITAPEVVMDVAGDVMTETAFNARYGL